MKLFWKHEVRVTHGKRPFLSLILLVVLLAACGGGADSPTVVPISPTNTAVPPTDTAVPPTDTPIPPTATAVSPTNTPISPTPTQIPAPVSTETEIFNDEAGRVSFHYPASWEMETEEMDHGGLTVITAPEIANPDFTQPFGFFSGEVKWVAGSDDPVTLLTQWASESGLQMIGEPTVTESDGIRRVSEEAVINVGDDQTLSVTAVVIVNGSRYGIFVAGTTPSGEEVYKEVVVAILDTVEVYDFDLEALGVMPAADADAIVIDFSNPASVMQGVIDSARFEVYDELAGLCDPLGENDGDTAVICEMTANHPDKDELANYFAFAHITGQVTIDGDHAQIPFIFGPDGDQEETMDFILRDGKWYLYGF